MITEKKRESNIELFRIITMLLIVAHHYVVNSGLFEPINQNIFSAKSLFYLIFGAWGKTGINCFVLISAYFMCQSKLTLRRYLKLLMELYFYRFILYFIFLLTGMDSFSGTRFLRMFLPFSTIADSFTSSFMAFYLLIPFMNAAIRAFSRKQHLGLVFLLIVIYTVMGLLPGVQVTFNYVTWFVVLYFIGSYLRLYDPAMLRRNAGRKLLATLALSVCSIVALAYYAARTGKGAMTSYNLLSDSNRPLALAVAVFALLYFSQLNIGYRAWINKIAASTFGVFLIHTHSDAMRSWLWGSILRNQQMYSSSWAVIHAFGSVLAVFAVCALIDRIRIIAFEQPFFRLFDRKEPQISSAVRKKLDAAFQYICREK